MKVTLFKVVGVLVDFFGFEFSFARGKKIDACECAGRMGHDMLKNPEERASFVDTHLDIVYVWLIFERGKSLPKDFVSHCEHVFCKVIGLCVGFWRIRKRLSLKKLDVGDALWCLLRTRQRQAGNDAQ